MPSPPLPVLIALTGLLACSGGGATPAATTAAADERDTHQRWLAACQAETATFEACRAHCDSLTGPTARTDCYFQLAEAAPRWTAGDARRGVALAYSLCGSSADFGTQCFRHALHEVAITCDPRGVAWLDVPGWQAGDRWSDWQSCVGRNVLGRQGAACLPAMRASYHNLWTADDAPLCGQ